jgi:hypothetical protein
MSSLIPAALAILFLQIFGYLQDKKECEDLQKRAEQVEQEVAN